MKKIILLVASLAMVSPTTILAQEDERIVELESLIEDTEQQLDDYKEELNNLKGDSTQGSERDNSSAVETILTTGTWKVGTDIPAGRYVITGDGSGNLFIGEGMNSVNEILDNSGTFGVSSITTDISEGEEVEISGLNSVTFTPAETELSNQLTTGDWVVGLDIEPGRYEITPAEPGSGNLFIGEGFDTVNEILDSSGEFGVQTVTAELVEGDSIRISGLATVDFTSVD